MQLAISQQIQNDIADVLQKRLKETERYKTEQLSKTIM